MNHPNDRSVSDGTLAPVAHASGSPASALGALLDDLAERMQAGEAVDLEAVVREHPDRADDLRRLLPALQLLADVAPSSAPAHRAGADGPGRLGDFRLLRELGRGGMGVVYEAEQISLNRRVALKVLPFAGALDPRQLQRFQREAQAAAQLHHPHIVPVFGVGSERGVHFYAMQLIEGRTLADVVAELHGPASTGTSGANTAAYDPAASDEYPVLSTQYPAPPPQAGREPDTAPVAAAPTPRSRPDRAYFRAAARWGIQAAEALEYAHSMGVIHRDVKPANLLLDARGDVWMTDFGLAQFRAGADLTVSGAVLGTFRYMSPEQARAKHGLVDHRTDVYSLGVTLYELLALRPAFAAEDREELLRQVIAEEPPPPRRVNKAVPAELETIVLKAMAKEPDSRYATAQELADDLRRFLEDRPIVARRPSLAQRLVKWARRHRPAVASAAAALLLAVILLVKSHVDLSVERTATARQRDFARQVVDDMYTGVAEQWLEHAPEMEEVQRTFLLKALHYYEELARAQANDPSVRAATALAYRRVGDIRRRLGEPAGAEAYEQAVRLFRRLADDFPDRPDYRDALATCYHRLGGLLISHKRHPEAERAYRAAVELRQQALDAAPDSLRSRCELGVAVSDLGRLLHFTGQRQVGSSRVDLQACKLEYSIVSPK